MHFADHPTAIVGLSNILLDIYSEELLPTPAVPGLISAIHAATAVPSNRSVASTVDLPAQEKHGNRPALPSVPLGLATGKVMKEEPKVNGGIPSPLQHDTELTAPYKATSLPLVDRLAARDRAYVLLSGLTKLGSGWNYSDAWFALARAHEESGQPEKAKDVLWWCVELEEGMGVREWSCVNTGGYVL